MKRTSEWKSFLINNNQIEVWGNKAVLIKMPSTSHYKGYSFWHPLKLVRSEGKQYSVSFNDNFIFKLKKNGFEKTISAFEIEDTFPLSTPLIHTPAYLEPGHTKVDESLIDNE